MSLANLQKSHPPGPVQLESSTDRAFSDQPSDGKKTNKAQSFHNNHYITSTSEEIEVAMDANKLDNNFAKDESESTLTGRFTSMGISSYQRHEISSLKRSFSLDIKSVYTSLTTSTEANKHFYQPSRSQLVPSKPISSKPMGLWDRFLGFGLNFLYFYSEEEAQEKQTLDHRVIPNCEQEVPENLKKRRANTKILDEGPSRPFTLNIPSCISQTILNDKTLEVGSQ